MSANPRPPIPSFIPESAPFSPEQRVWLNGLFAGLYALDQRVTPLTEAQAAKMLPDVFNEPDDGAPWHDQTMALSERMKLAEGRPLRRRMMAAMAQQDCGQCGYNCHDYSEALFARTETRLNLCVPGGKDTARALKQLYAELEPPAAPVAPPDVTEKAQTVVPPTAGYSRDNPVSAMLFARHRLNKPASQRETWHVEFDLGDTGLTYAAGDSLGVFPVNDPELVDAVIAALGAPADFPIGGRTLRETLTDGISLSPAPDMLFQLISYLTGGERKQKARALAVGQDPDGDSGSLDVLAALQKFPGTRPDPEAFIECLDVLQPRVYSISSSSKANPGRVSVTVDAVRYEVDRRTRLGVASTFLAGRVAPGQKVRLYIQKARDFSLPADPASPVIMIGPGTGIAPFRAFLQERMATKAPGENWLFFGHQHYDTDFFYRDELSGMKAAGVLTHLFLAWSRDDIEKFYVQDRMRQVGMQLWQCITRGAHIYVCGALAMGRDVERALVELIAEHGAREQGEAAAFLAEMRRKGRYQIDVY